LFSTLVSRASAGLLVVGGLGLLFVPDAVLPRASSPASRPAASGWDSSSPPLLWS
jgi:hypothetical protein